MAGDNFAFGNNSDFFFYFQYYNDTTIFDNHQVYKELRFVEFTLNIIL